MPSFQNSEGHTETVKALLPFLTKEQFKQKNTKEHDLVSITVGMGHVETLKVLVPKLTELGITITPEELLGYTSEETETEIADLLAQLVEES